MQQEDFYLEFQRLHPNPYFGFAEIPLTKEFVFEKLDLQNFQQLYLLFENDQSPFVDVRFKTYDGAYGYAKYLTVCGAFTPKHGSQDWFFRLPSGEYGGILHLYDLSMETFAQNNKRAWIGFATKENFRRRGITLKVVQHFINYIFEFYPSIDFIHAMTLTENEIAKKILIKAGFVKDLEERASKKHDFFLLRRAGLS